MSRKGEVLRRKDICCMCHQFKPIKAHGMCQNCWHKYKRKNIPYTYLRYKYSEMKDRVTNKKKQCAKYYYGLQICSIQDFMDRFTNDLIFLQLFEEWKQSGWEYKLTPSIDRIDKLQGYIIPNLQFLTHSDNAKKDQIRLPIKAIFKDGHEEIFESQTAASQYLHITQSNIWKVLNKERKYAGGIYFEYI